MPINNLTRRDNNRGRNNRRSDRKLREDKQGGLI